jgi:dTMP kinase
LVQIIKPALAEGKIVLCDRFVDSSLAYQGYARGLGITEVWDINQFATDGIFPDKTIFLSVSTETGKKRMNIRGEKDRLESEPDLFHIRVREGYDLVNSMYPERITVISAEPDVETVTAEVWKEIEKVIYE